MTLISKEGKITYKNNYRVGVILFYFVVTSLLSGVCTVLAAGKTTEFFTTKENVNISITEETDKSSSGSESILNSKGVYVMPVIVVTATKKSTSESLQDVPAAISVYPGEAIEDNFVQDLTDIGQISPNVKLDDIGTFPNTANFFIRGRGSSY